MVLNVNLPEDAEHRHDIGVVDAEHKDARFGMVIVAREMPDVCPSWELINQERIRKGRLEYRVPVKPDQDFRLILQIQCAKDAEGRSNRSRLMRKLHRVKTVVVGAPKATMDYGGIVPRLELCKACCFLVQSEELHQRSVFGIVKKGRITENPKLRIG